MRPPGQTSRKGAGLGADKRRAGPEGVQRAPLARARHPPSGGLVSGAVVGSFARGTWGASAAYYQCPNHPGGNPHVPPGKPPGAPIPTAPENNSSQLRRRAGSSGKGKLRAVERTNWLAGSETHCHSQQKFWLVKNKAGRLYVL
jgi:hypothetical protein